jgi:CubicO group peptidase (beta-lactamase class C family)
MKRLTLFILSILTLTALACGSGPVGGGGADVTALDLDAILADYADPAGPATVVYVSTPEGARSAASGYADLSTGQPATPGETFRIGSVSKMFTAVAVLQLVDAGVLSLDDTPADWLSPGLTADLSNAQEATVEQLLNHSSGVPDYLDAFFIEDAYAQNRRWQPAETLEYAAGYAAPFAPGRNFEYSNTNYILLHLMAEAASGQGLHSLIRGGVITPLGLTSTYTQVYEPGTATARGYEDINTDGSPDDVTTLNDGAGLGDGGLISTGADVAAFLDALVLREELLAAATHEAMLTDYGYDYGLGIERNRSPWGPQIGHGGAVTGYEALAYTFPDYETTVVVLTGDYDNVDLNGIMDEVMNALYP